MQFCTNKHKAKILKNNTLVFFVFLQFNTFSMQENKTRRPRYVLNLFANYYRGFCVEYLKNP